MLRGWWRRRRLRRSVAAQEAAVGRLVEFLHRLDVPADRRVGWDGPTRPLPVVDARPLLTRAGEIRADHATRRLLP